ncbi:hypothetical protein BC937DRAFT_90899 [Endogone sp. FLAS-F59071]|nr:hypothetical protein BC937DRAFT_90899 [Endogone sp. FLAS-F59071]|eukprot:RUS16702.1 hypothetical protein BC937DRAFT_90899 [Endogone sp. FLAS-F59071]
MSLLSSRRKLLAAITLTVLVLTVLLLRWDDSDNVAELEELQHSTHSQQPPVGTEHGTDDAWDVGTGRVKDSNDEQILGTHVDDDVDMDHVSTEEPQENLSVVKELPVDSSPPSDPEEEEEEEEEAPDSSSPIKTLPKDDAVEADSSLEEKEKPVPLIDEPKYLTFLPHSGFHNQRIAVQNAFYLAFLLNRTLLLPPAMLGNVFGWRAFNILVDWHLFHSKVGHENCAKFASLTADMQKAANMSNVCNTMNSYTYVRWELLYDLKTLKAKVSYLPRDYFTNEYLQDQFNISTNETWYFKDEWQYDAMIFDSNVDLDPKKHNLGKYHSLLRIPDLQARPEKLIYLGSLFGSGRMVTSTKENRSLHDWVNSQFIFSNPVLLQTLDNVVAAIGGPRTYASLHARVGDGAFARGASKVMNQLWSDFSGKFPPLPGGAIDPATPTECLDPLTRPEAVRNGSLPLIFMATDERNPRKAKLFAKFFAAYPCIITLNDVFDYATSPLAELSNPIDGLKLGKFMIPFLDGLVASRAKDFTTSIWSTFSMYIRFIHRDFTKKWTAEQKNKGVGGLRKRTWKRVERGDRSDDVR